jgi:twinkle protein
MTQKITELHIPCETCGSSDAKCVYEDGHGYCFSCNEYYPSMEEISNDVYTYEYLPWRSISKSTFKKFNVSTKIDKDGKPISVGFSYPNGAIKVRQRDEKAFHWTNNNGKAGLFGRNIFSTGNGKYVTITEGELDALSLYELLGTPVVSVQSASSARSDVAMERSWLQSFDRIYLCFDGDEAGRRATEEVARMFDFNKVYHVKLTRHKDANEYLSAGDGEELKQLWTNSKKYLPSWVISSNEDFKKILDEPDQVGISYPFPTLNYMTYGIRTGESVLITAKTGVGKTELMHSILHKVLRETDENVGAIFLEEPKKRLLQSLAGIEVKRPVHLPDCYTEPGEVYGALTKLLRRDDRLHVYSHFGSDDPEVLLDTIRFLVSARDVRYVFLDHISMAVSGLGGEDERKALDYLCTRLEMMVKELDFALIFVSHVNDYNQTRGSRYISMIADIRIHLERDFENSDRNVANTTWLSITKPSRFSGRAGPAGKLVFDPVTHILSEDLLYDNDNEQVLHESAA